MSLFMKPGTALALRKISELTREKCEACPSRRPMKPTRCCDRLFCEIATVTMRELGGAAVEPTGHPELLYMGEKGCVISPEFRPVCSGYVCEHHFDNPGFASRHANLQERISADLNVQRAVAIAQEEIGGLAGAINRFRREHQVDVASLPFEPGDRVAIVTGEAYGDGAVIEGEVTFDDGGPRVTVLVDGFECSDTFPREHVVRVSEETK